MHTCGLNKSTSRGARGGSVPAVLGECLGSTAQHILCQCPNETAFMAGCGGARWGAEQWLFVCCSFLLAVIIAPPPLKMASRLLIMQVGAHVHAFMLPQECIHASASCLWREDVCFFFLKIWKWAPCYLLFLAIYKRFSASENVYDSSSVFQALVIIQLADAWLFWYEGKVKTGRLQSVIGHVATPPQGVGSAWGKDLAPPERPGVRAD